MLEMKERLVGGLHDAIFRFWISLTDSLWCSMLIDPMDPSLFFLSPFPIGAHGSPYIPRRP
jgi:hypothetical protein